MRKEDNLIMEWYTFYGFECYLTDKTARELKAEQERYEADLREVEIERELYRWLQDPANWDSEIYSDVYKDVYGFRPRW